MGTKTCTNSPNQYGGARRDRTADLNTASVALSQLSYGPLVEFDNYTDFFYFVYSLFFSFIYSIARDILTRVLSLPSNDKVISIEGDTPAPETATRSG